MKIFCNVLRQCQSQRDLIKNPSSFHNIFKSNKRMFSTAEAAKPVEVASTTNINYEKEWSAIYEQTVKAQKNIINSELSEYEKKEVHALIDRVTKLNKEEMMYYVHLVTAKSNLMAGCDVRNIDASNPEVFMNSVNTWPKENTKWFSTPGLQSTISSFSGQTVGVTSAASGTAPEVKKSEQPKIEKKVEKSQYDVKLVSFDAAKKIALIKEIRAWLNLGLKEAKELVEKAPTDLKKAMKKEEAEEIKKKLSESGASIELI